MNSRIKSQNAFTLFEAMIGISIIAVLSSFGYAALSTSNKNATSVRLATLAQELARDQIDQVESAEPFNLDNNPPLIPAALTVGTTTTIHDGQHTVTFGTPAVTYTIPGFCVDPATGNTVIPATVTLTVADLGSNNAYSALVTVSYTYRGKSYQVQMSTIRTSDS